MNLEYDNSSNGFEVPLPGTFPYTAGIHSEMYKSKPWNIKQYAGYGIAEDANLNFKKLISSGSSGISIAFDLVTQMGIDPMSKIATHEVGRVGVSINNLDDMRKLLNGLDLGKISASMTINSTAGILLLMYQIVAEENGISSNVLRGTIQNDILKEFITRSTYIFPPEASLRFTNDIFEYSSKELPHWNPISVSGYHFSEAGATPAQELAFAISNAVLYLEKALARGLNIESIAEKFTFFFTAKTNLLEEISKFRVARKIWANILVDKFDFLPNSKALKMRIHAQTAGSQLTSFGVENNYARVTIQALAAVLGGVQSLHTNSFNEALSLPTEKSSKFAINIQHILMEETDLLKAADPLRGSYVIENLTLVLEREVLEIIKSIEKLGGVVDCINLGYQRNLIERNSFIESKSVAENTKKIVGLNTGVVIDETEDNEAFYFRQPTQDKNLFKIEKKAVQLNYEFKSLKEAALGDQNVMYPIKDLILKGATVSQICDVLKECWGVYSA